MSARYDSRQHGMVLIVALVFLLIITIAAIVSFNMSKTSLDIVGNTQSRDAVIASANSAIQEALSTTRMFEAPDTVFLVPCSAANTKCYDINGDGTDDIEVALTPSPTCVNWQNIQNSSLDLSDADDAACASGSNQQFGIEGAPTGNSLCANSLWEITAQASDEVTSAKATVTAGAAVRVSQDDVLTSCP